MTRAMYAFSGDPITFGHIDIIKRAANAFDHIVVGIGVNPQKKYLFTLAERSSMAELALRDIPNVEVASFSGLLVDYAYEKGIDVIVKGVRNPEDFSYENILHQVGESQKLGIDTHILFARPHLMHVSSSAVKEIQKNQGDIHNYVPLCVKQQLERKLSNQILVGVTGEMGTGKSHISNILQSIKSHIPIHNIELDHIGHQILGELKDQAYLAVRKKVANALGEYLLNSDGFIDRKKLGDIVFKDVEKLKTLNCLLYTPINVRLRKEIQNKEGIILVNSALLAESDMLHICNNNVILLTIDKNTQIQRLETRGLTHEQINTRIACQYNYQEKMSKIQNVIQRDSHGKVWTIDNTTEFSQVKAQNLLTEIMEYFDCHV